jgi:hypothetical protein
VIGNDYETMTMEVASKLGEIGMKIAPQKSAILSNPIETEYGSINSPLSFRVNFCLLLIP